MRDVEQPDVQSETLSRKRRQTRTRLLDAAYEVFARVGVGAATVDSIVEQAGFTRGAFYSNFSSKSELFIALAEREDARCLQQVQQGAREAVEILDAEQRDGGPQTSRSTAVLGAVVDRFLALQVTSPDWYTIEQEIWLYGVRNPGFGATILQFERTLIHRIADIMEGIVRRYGLELSVQTKTATLMLSAVYSQFRREGAIAGSPAAAARLRAQARDALVTLVQALTAPSLAALRAGSDGGPDAERLAASSSNA